MIPAGSLDRRIELLELAETATNDLNEPTRGLTVTAEVWARLVGMTSSERIAAGQDQAQKTRVFEIRHRSDVTPGADRGLRYEGQVYDIKAVDPLPGREVGLRITAVARAE